MECFDSEITKKAYGVQPEIFQQLVEAVRDDPTPQKYTIEKLKLLA